LLPVACCLLPVACCLLPVGWILLSAISAVFKYRRKNIGSAFFTPNQGKSPLNQHSNASLGPHQYSKRRKGR
ncbi:MAG TPA: hypothetical protein PKZ52_06885, partial [Cellvibrionaceae bacterium]|nr:hypothetical protein [Cellvibrionaceae bacterium]